MKKLILLMAVVMSATMCGTTAQAEPTLILKVGGWPGADNSRNAGADHGFIYQIESGTCGRHCFAPYFVHFGGSSTQEDNDGIGVDYIYKPGNEKSNFRLAFGLVGFDDPLNGGEHGNFHFGAGFEIHTTDKVSIMVSIDHFSNGNQWLDRVGVDKNIPANLLTFGFHFR